LGYLPLLRYFSKWLQSAYLDPSSTQPLTDMSHLHRQSRRNNKAPDGSVSFYRDEPPLSRDKGSLRLGVPRSLNELSPAQLELALSVVHKQMHGSQLLTIWEPPEELSLLPQSEWLCLIEVWEQLQRQRRHNPLH
jgi:hypothetical protein